MALFYAYTYCRESAGDSDVPCVCVSKKVFFYNLKLLEPIFVIFGHAILTVLASKRMHTFPPHLYVVSCYTTREYISSIIDMSFSSGWLALIRSWVMWPTNDWRIPVFLEISTTNWCICGACTFMTNQEITNKDRILRSSWSATLWTPVSWTGVFSRLWRLRSSRRLPEYSFSNFWAV